MPFVDAAGVQVNFPFEPYPCQVTYMEKVVTCLRDSQNGILESPTGTGKTLCLLCSSLAWLETKRAQIGSQRWKLANAEGGGDALNEFKDILSNQLDSAAGTWDGELAPPKIIFASRTHSQLTQAIQELKRSAYRHFKVCVLGSREQLCIHPQIMKEESNTAKVHMCRAKVQNRSCHFYNQLEANKSNFANQVMDIEDLVNLGQKHNCCPYYAARELKAEADIIFMPYNYLLDVKSRKAHGVELNGNIVIFDEAHNLEKVCEESASFDLRSADIAAAMRELSELSDKVLEWVEAEERGEGSMNDSQTTIGQDFTLRDLVALKTMLSGLENEIDAVELKKASEGVTKPGSFIFDILKKINLTFETKIAIQEMVEKIVQHLTNETNSGIFSSRGAGLSKFADIIKIVFSRETENLSAITQHQAVVSRHYKVHIQQEEAPKSKKSDGWGNAAASAKPGRVLSYWCFSPGHAMEDLRAHGVKSIILTSGTLSPLSSFKTEMGIKFNVELENPHVIESHQVWIGTVSKGPDGTILNSSYQNRSKESYQSSLGNAVVNFARVVPNGMLIFFPSYGVMNLCVEHWQRSGIWSRIEQYKPIFVEPRYKAEFNTAMLNFYEKINDPTLNGAIFIAVCRGKVSEGLDFSDRNGRAVVITGLPFPPQMDAKVKLKKQFLDEMRSYQGHGLSGQEWYRQQATRAVNQAIGRVIRHKQDFGAIILCDNRFASTESKNQLPVWVRPSVINYSAFGLAIRDLMNFFKNVEKLMPLPGPAKKRSTLPAGRGAHSAFFMPTMTRTASGPVEKASTVINHHPSLKQRHARASEEMSLAKLKIEYEMPGQPAAGTSMFRGKQSKTSLIAALATEQKSATPLSQDHSLSDTQIPSYQKELRNSQAQAQVKAKKKIIIKKTTQTTDLTKDSLQSAESYVLEVKKTLSSDSYQYFSTTLAEYREKEDFLTMVNRLADIFTGNERSHHLFRRFYRFVRPHHKEQFDRMCREIIGHGCGYKPEDSIPKKRKTSAKDASIKEQKRAKVDEQSSKTPLVDNVSEKHKNESLASLARPHEQDDIKHRLMQTEKPAAAGSESHLESGSLSKTENPTTAIEPQDKVSLPEGQHIKNTKPDSSASKPQGNTSCIGNKQECVNSEKETSKTAKVVPRGEEAERQDEASLLRKENVDSNNARSTPALAGAVSEGFPRDKAYLLGAKADLGYDCALCKKVALLPFKAPCGHVCCVACWKVAIKESQSCPACGARVKRKYLVQICFGSRAQPN